MDPSWCPGCDRLILPKRLVVPVDPTPAPPHPVETDSEDSERHPPPPPAPTPVPSSPEVRRKPQDQQPTRTTRRLGGGLVHGTGRVRPGGGLRKEKRQQTQTVVEPTPAPQPAPAPKKTRVIISQEPTPLYCSEECRIRDLKNSFLQSEVAGFAAAPAAFNRINQLELVQETIRRLKSCRPTSPTSRSPQSSPSTSPETPTNSQTCPLTTPPVPPNSLTNLPHPIFRTESMSSCGTDASYPESVEHDTDTTIRIPRRKSHPPRVPSWGSPTKSSLAPPAKTLYNASSSSLDSMALSVGASLLFEEGPVLCTMTTEAEETASTTPSKSSSDTGGKKKKRVSFASDSKPAISSRASHHRVPRPRNPLLEANPVRAALSLSPKDKLVRPSSLPTNAHATTSTPHPSTATHTATTQYHSKSTPDLARLASSRATETPPKNPYGVAMWPEDEKRSTPCTQVHGDLIRGYAKRFAPREERSLMYSRLWKGLQEEEEQTGEEVEERKHDEREDGEREYWMRYEERERERRAKRKAEEKVRRAEEARVIEEMLGGTGCAEEDQPQARRMGKIAYDGMPGPAENRGLKYEFNQFLYDLVPVKPQIVERPVERWDPARQQYVQEIWREEIFPERKKLFNFDD